MEWYLTLLVVFVLGMGRTSLPVIVPLPKPLSSEISLPSLVQTL